MSSSTRCRPAATRPAIASARRVSRRPTTSSCAARPAWGGHADALGRVTSARQFSQLPEAGNNIRLTIDAELQRAAEEALDYGIRLRSMTASGPRTAARSSRWTRATVRSSLLHPIPPSIRSVYVGRLPERPEGPRRALGQPSHAEPCRLGVHPPGSTSGPSPRSRRSRRGSSSRTSSSSARARRSSTPDVHELGPVRERAHDADDRARRLLRHLLLPSGDAFLRARGRAAPGVVAPLRIRPQDRGLGPEEAGLVPTIAWKQRYFKHPIDKIWTSGDSVQLSIGQGDFHDASADDALLLAGRQRRESSSRTSSSRSRSRVRRGSRPSFSSRTS